MRSCLTAVVAAAALLAGCGSEESVKTAPVVSVGPDIDMPLNETVNVIAQASDADGLVERFEWKLVRAPTEAAPELETRGEKGEICALRPFGVSGVYVLSVTAIDDDGLVSEPDFVNVTLRPRE
jgi:hypothetical protein